MLYLYFSHSKNLELLALDVSPRQLYIVDQLRHIYFPTLFSFLYLYPFTPFYSS